MKLKISDNLRKMMEKEKLSLDKSESDKLRLIVNMGKKDNKGFKPLTDDDLYDDISKDKINLDNPSLDEIKKYVSEHTSGIRKHYDLAEGGTILVSFSKFVEMINDGYNIYQSEVINENFINIRYQKEIKREGRGR